MDSGTAPDGRRVWLAERPDAEYADAPLTYATPDGERCLEVERARALAVADTEATPVALTARPDELAPVEDPERRERLATGARQRARGNHPEHTL